MERESRPTGLFTNTDPLRSYDPSDDPYAIDSEPVSMPTEMKTIPLETSEPSHSSGTLSYPEMKQETRVIDYPRLSKSADSVVISVPDFSYRDKRVGKYVLYTIRGNDATGTFDTSRRYKDFEWLRKLLVLHWPGCYVPAIPGKQMMGNLKPEFIETRRKLLEEFLCKTVAVDFLYSSEVFQLFIRGNEDYKNSTQHFASVSIPNLCATYSSTFSLFAETEMSTYMEVNIEETKKFVKEMTKFLENFSNRIKFVSVYYSNFIEGFNNMCKVIEEYDADFLSDFRENKRSSIKLEVKTSHVNPYELMLDWTRAEILDHAALLEALSKVEEIQKILVSLNSKLSSERATLLKIQAGKKTLAQFLKKKTKEDQTSAAEGAIKNVESEIRDHEYIMKVIITRLSEFEIPRFKSAKADKYDMVLRTYANASVSEFKYVRYI